MKYNAMIDPAPVFITQRHCPVLPVRLKRLHYLLLPPLPALLLLLVVVAAGSRCLRSPIAGYPSRQVRRNQPRVDPAGRRCLEQMLST